MEEIWKPVVGMPDRYQVSNQGRVKSLKFKGHKGFEKILSPNVDVKGYPAISVYVNGKHTIRRVHRMVAEAFIPNPLGKPMIDHIDGDKTNNNVDNLRWATNKENLTTDLARMHFSMANRRRYEKNN